MDNSQKIPFMDSYCDRWCEKCPMTARCAIFDPKWVSPEWDEQTNEQLWEEVSKNFKETLSALKQLVESEGMDWEQLVEDAKDIEIPEPELSELEENTLDLSNTYCFNTLDWLKDQRPVIENFVQEAQQHLEIGIGNPEESVFQVGNALEIIQWYSTMITSKINRAIKGAYDDWDDEEDPIQNDANGSAKLTMICIDRSISAWEKIRQEIPEMEDELLDYLALLSKMRRGLKSIFPNYDAFIRPGFDTEELVNVR